MSVSMHLHDCKTNEGRCASASLIADTNQYKLLKDRELTTRAMALEADLKEGQYSMFGFGSGMNLYNSYMPFRVISR